MITLPNNLIKSYLKFDEYTFEVFISLIFREYYTDTYSSKSCKCLLVTPSSYDKGIDSIFEVVDRNNTLIYPLIQITKANKSDSQLKSFVSPDSEQYYQNISLNFMASRKERFLISHDISHSKKVDNIICSNNLANIIYKYIVKFNLCDSNGHLKQDFINHVDFITAQWHRANNLRDSKLSYQEFILSDSFKYFSLLQNICNTNLKMLNQLDNLLLYSEMERKNSYLRRCSHNSQSPTCLDYKIQSGLDKIFQLNQHLNSHDLNALAYLLKLLYPITNNINDQSSNLYHLSLDFRQPYLCIKKVSKQNQSDSQVIAYFNYFFARQRPSYVFNFLDSTEDSVNNLKNSGLLIKRKSDNVSDSRNFRGDIYWVLPNKDAPNFKEALTELIIQANNHSHVSTVL